ncbi:MAG TPA: ATP-binding protein [Longimicrobiales bacterium]|nr:ATP-binding protein [Longimicrobiales bacterium]
MGETRVDLVHLLEDLRDAYPGSLEETILTEIIANALDSGADTLAFDADSAESTLIATDNGRGMTKRELSRYHDLATTTKRRGSGIGFAGVGIKLGLLACNQVITETRRGKQHTATSWKLSNRSRAPWSWIEPPHMLERDGTAVLMHLSNPLSQLLDAGFIEATVLRHYQPLFEPEFLDILAGSYPDGFTIVVNGHAVVGPIRGAERHPIAIRVGRQRKPTGVGYIARHDEPLPEPERGLAISTLGKVIRRGWDWLGVTPANAERIEGVIEVPALADALTLNKGDFLRHGARGALFMSYRKAIQEAVTAQFTEWGAAPALTKRAPRTRPMERDIRRILGDLAGDYPMLATLVERRAGGQRRLALGEAADIGDLRNGWAAGEALVADDAAAGEQPHENAGTAAGAVSPGDQQAGNGGDAGAIGGGHDVADGNAHGPGRTDPPGDGAPGKRKVAAQLPGRGGRKQPATLSLAIRFESRADDSTLGRLIESTVFVNDAHPAYRRAVTSRAEGYHIAVSVAAALAPLTVEAADAQSFISAFLARWGEAAGEKADGRDPSEST